MVNGGAGRRSHCDSTTAATPAMRCPAACAPPVPHRSITLTLGIVVAAHAASRRTPCYTAENTVLFGALRARGARRRFIERSTQSTCGARDIRDVDGIRRGRRSCSGHQYRRSTGGGTRRCFGVPGRSRRIPSLRLPGACLFSFYVFLRMIFSFTTWTKCVDASVTARLARRSAQRVSLISAWNIGSAGANVRWASFASQNETSS